MDGWWGAGDWFRDDSRALHLLYALFLLLLHQFHLRSLGIRSQRLGIPAVGRKVCERSWCNGGGTSKLETTGSLPADSDAQLEEDPRASVFRSWLFFTMDLPSEWTWLMFTWTTIVSRRSLLPHSILTTKANPLCICLPPSLRRLEQRPILFIRESLLPGTLVGIGASVISRVQLFVTP